MSNATIPETCVKDSDCTSFPGYTKGCCMMFDFGSIDLSAMKDFRYTKSSGKVCAPDEQKMTLDLMAA